MTNYATESLSTLITDLNAAVAGVNSLSGYATKEELTAYATETYVQDYVDEHSGGDYLPLSGGNVTGRIYLETSIPGDRRWKYEGSGEDGSFTITTSPDYSTAQVVLVVFETEMINTTINSTSTGSGYYFDTGLINFNLEGDHCHLSCDFTVVDNLTEPMINGFETWDFELESELFVNENGAWSYSGDLPVETTDPFVLSSELTSAIGSINTILDSINGQIV